ncbi:dipeptide/oligopeptide/nickel ABC transporter permease/ATP-binding protein [Olsenella sp. YH-ols2217]|uniref:Dipeptide/oligopeptide/nickel ABC transporter permease/ATP-binding protein n=1 Tax=Kribbibacterium absianum TaxID=3044210 RepID=A0ABT6ZI97_9ACTN|nr:MULTISPECIES: dipeptide/oligopeptide/nickel ABC transporter permease/ATP-binding protein [unclassified Olsenella]MDJ1121290.1 dipeptide/oligopeptide/nickel ABC transporter permease/ATP-binding protein [Olsenella sp. YH-ols2216]MDJ1128780.1 dipeptide/oligopeptide/nickel ABC transporter permease/ATP-binding protein [Olsenella sp. YH-ols2217]
MAETAEKKSGGVGLARRWKAMSIGSRISIVVLIVVALVAILAEVLAPYSPYEIFKARQAPSGEFLFGTDEKGRDILSRMMYGARFSLAIGFGAVGLALVCGSIIGSIAAVSRKWLSEVIMRCMDIIMAFPGIALAAVFVSVFGNSVGSIVLAIGFIYIPQVSRIVRANVVAEYGEDYVRAVVVSGAKAPWILFKHVMRNCIAPILVYVIVLVADAIILEASLSFISAGIQEPTPTWGNILSDARSGVLAGRWWQALFPGLAIMITVLCLNIFSEGITDAMVAAPNAPVNDDGKHARKEDRLLFDPVAAYEEQKGALDASLEALEKVEAKRGDRHVPDYSVKPILEVKDLCIKFPRHGDVNVVDHVNYAVRPHQTMGLVGESGCGKSITALTIMGLLDSRAIVSGQILYQGKDLLKMTPKERNDLRGHEIAMIYQDALSSLNPSMLIKNQMKQLTDRGGTRSAEELLELVGLDPARTLESYPHELSGGQRQRVLIAMALTRDPKVIIADEPTTALDVTVQKQVIKLLNDLQAKLGFAMVFVSHDLALVAEVAHYITVMYAGQVVEQAPTMELLMHPTHEYTRGLLGAVLSIEGGAGRLHQVPGVVPSPKDFNQGDRFAPRSSHPTVGLDVRPVLKQIPGTQHFVAELPDEELAKAGLPSKVAQAANRSTVSTPSTDGKGAK